MAFTLQAFKEDVLASDITDSATSMTLTTGAFGTPSGEQMLVIDYNIAAKREIVKCAIDGTAVTSIDRAQDGTAAVAHTSGAKILMAFVPSHYTDIFTTVYNTLYPVGSIYINAGVATNPGTLLGFGTWEAYGAGKVIVGLNAAETEFDTLGETGGEKTHQLSVAELPAHHHTYNGHDDFNGGAGASNIGAQNAAKTTSDTGSGTAHNNLQPYIVAYMWKRTA